MKKSILLVFASLLLSIQLFAQTAQEQVVKMKSDQPAGWVLEIEQDKNLVEKVLLEEFSKTGINRFKRDSKGFRVAQGGVWNVLGEEQRDVYYRVKGNKKKATIEIVAATGYSNFLSQTNQANQFNSIGAFLNGIADKVAAQMQDDKINALKDRIAALQKSKASTEKENAKLLKNIESQQKKIDSNTKNMQKEAEEITTLQQELSKLESL